MKSNKALGISAIIISLITISHSYASIYLGGKLGWNILDNNCFKYSECDDNSPVVSTYLGYEFNENFGLELSVDHLPDLTINTDKNSITQDLVSVNLAPKFIIPISDRLRSFVKVGAAYNNFNKKSDISPTAGLGIEFKKKL